MGDERDPHGQPYNVAFNRARRTERDLSEMLGIAKGMLSDGEVTEEEARYLREWGINHPDALDQWPLNLIFRRLSRYFADGRIDNTERADLKESWRVWSAALRRLSSVTKVRRPCRSILPPLSFVGDQTKFMPSPDALRTERALTASAKWNSAAAPAKTTSPGAHHSWLSVPLEVATGSIQHSVERSSALLN